MDDTTVGLAEAVERLRAELEVARAAGDGKELRFRLGDVQLELGVEFAKEGGAEAGIRLWVVSVGATGTASSLRSNKVTVTLVPQVKTSTGGYEDAYVGDKVDARPPAPHTSE
jgi:hypothetical protein